MSDPINLQVRKKLGKNLKKIIEEKVPESDLRNLDAITGKDHSWLGKIFNGTQNMTIDSLTELLVLFKIQPKDVFNFRVTYQKED